jgi:tetratricopeptide (TPR) repeat protein
VTDPHPTSAPDIHRLTVLVESVRAELAQRELRKQLEQFPDDGRLHALMAVTFLKQNRLEHALQAASEAKRLEPLDPLINHAWASAHAARSGHPESEAVVREAMANGPVTSTMFSLLGEAIMNGTRIATRRRSRDALEALDAGLRLDSEHYDCLLFRTQALTRLRRYDEARVTADEVLRLAPEAAGGHAVRGYVEQCAGERRRAYSHYLKALRLDPNEAFTHKALENERWAAAMMSQLGVARWPLRVVCTVGLVVVVPLGLAEGHYLWTVGAASYLLGLHPDLLSWLCPPEVHGLYSPPGALRPRDVWKARRTIAWRVFGAVVTCGGALEASWMPF